jgi:hypothetical protein
MPRFYRDSKEREMESNETTNQLGNEFKTDGDAMVPREGFEPPTLCLEDRCSIH